MVQKIFIFKIFLIIFIFNNSPILAKNIIGLAKIIDGDTVYINNNKIRLHGIDAPEKNQLCFYNKIKWPCGKQSSNELEKIINNEILKCSTIDIDKYGRYVAICYKNNLDINKIMVRKGWSIAYRYYSKDYIRDENYARLKKIGIWKSKFEEPYKFRKKNK